MQFTINSSICFLISTVLFLTTCGLSFSLASRVNTPLLKTDLIKSAKQKNNFMEKFIKVNRSNSRIDKFTEVNRSDSRINMIEVTKANKKLSIPNTDLFPRQRQKAISKIAKEIRNQPRYKTIDGITYQINDGPLPDVGESNLAARIIKKEKKLLDSYSRDLIPVLSASGLMFDNYEKMYDRLSKFIERPLTSIDFGDESFAQDRLTFKGFQMKLVQKKQGYASIELTDGQVKEICGYSLYSVFRNSKLFILDLSHVSEFNDPKAPSKHAPGVIAYFCVNRNSTFVPLSIHVSGGLKYSRFDTKDEWTLAKMIVNAAEMNDKQISHFVENHMVLEPIRVEMMRKMSTRHPVYVILNHHFLQLFANTRDGLAKLLSKGSLFDSFFAYGATGALRAVSQRFKELHFTKSYFRSKMRRNGLDSIPNFKYRDDCTAHIRATEEFLFSYLKQFYKDNDAIKGDFELQNWAKASAATNGVNGFPHEFSTLSSLVDAITHMIFLTSIKHHVVNSKSTWHSLSFPYSLPALWAPLPKVKGQQQDLQSYFPLDYIHRAFLTALVSAFNRAVPESVSLLKSYNTSFLGWGSDAAIKKYQSRMQQLSKKISIRETHSRRPFKMLSPENLPHYVWI